MELRHLRYFVAVAEELNMTRAAARLYMTQPALSRQIKELEKSVDVELVLRSSTGLTLTPAGREFLPQAREILERSTQAKLSMRQHSQCRKSSLSIGYIAPALGSFLGEALQVFAQRHPQIEVRLSELTPAKQVEALRSGLLDVALLGHACPDLARDLDLVAVRHIPLQVVLPKAHALAHLKKLDLGALAQENFIGFSPEVFPGRNEVLREAARRHGFTPKIAHEADGLMSALALVGSGLGVGLMPDEVAQLPHPNAVFVPLKAPGASIVFSAALAKGEKRAVVRAIMAEFLASVKRGAAK